MSYQHVAVTEFGDPGPQRDQLIEAILSGGKTTTSSLYLDYKKTDTPLPRADELYRLVDSDNLDVAILKILDVQICALERVPLAHALAEGEGFENLAQWRRAHEAFWQRSSSDPAHVPIEHEINDHTLVVLETFRVERLLSAKSARH